MAIGGKIQSAVAVKCREHLVSSRIDFRPEVQGFFPERAVALGHPDVHAALGFGRGQVGGEIQAVAIWRPCGVREDVALLNEREGACFAPFTRRCARGNQQLIAAVDGVAKPSDAAVGLLRKSDGASVGRQADDAVVVRHVHCGHLLGPHDVGAALSQAREPRCVAVEPCGLIGLAPLVGFAAEVQLVVADAWGGCCFETGEAQRADLPMPVILVHVQLCRAAVPHALDILRGVFLHHQPFQHIRCFGVLALLHHALGIVQLVVRGQRCAVTQFLIRSLGRGKIQQVHLGLPQQPIAHGVVGPFGQCAVQVGGGFCVTLFFGHAESFPKMASTAGIEHDHSSYQDGGDGH